MYAEVLRLTHSVETDKFCKSDFSESLWLLRKGKFAYGIPPLSWHGEPCPGKTVISYKSGRIICNSGGTVGKYYTPHPVWDEGVFLFSHPESQIIKTYTLLKRKELLLW